jgi:transcriptional regulator with XRE-family HTH domain
MVDARVVPLNQRSKTAVRREPTLRQVFGTVLRRARLAQGRTLADVAQEAQVSTPYLSEIERGLKEASSEVLAAICRALDMRALDLVARTYAELNELEPQRRDERDAQRRPLTVEAPPSPTRLPSRWQANGPVALAA